MFKTISGTAQVAKTDFISTMNGDCVNFLMTNFGDCVIPYCIISTLQPTNNNNLGYVNVNTEYIAMKRRQI